MKKIPLLFAVALSLTVLGVEENPVIPFLAVTERPTEADLVRKVDALKADRRGMKVWLYDEYNWPSGTCRGRVPNEDERFRYAEWAVYREPDGSFRWQKVLAPRGWVNVLDAGAMTRFIELTHEVYEKRLAKWFAKKPIRGIFTDEPGHPLLDQAERCRTTGRTVEMSGCALVQSGIMLDGLFI